MDCENCKNKQPEMVSRYAMEELAARQDIANRRSHRLNILLVILLLLSWLGFVIRQSQFETVTTSTTTQEVEQQADGDGSNNFVGGDYYGNETENQNDKNNNKIPSA